MKQYFFFKKLNKFFFVNFHIFVWYTVPGASKWQKKSSLRGKFPILIDNFWKFLKNRNVEGKSSLRRARRCISKNVRYYFAKFCSKITFFCWKFSVFFFFENVFFYISLNFTSIVFSDKVSISDIRISGQPGEWPSNTWHKSASCAGLLNSFSKPCHRFKVPNHLFNNSHIVYETKYIVIFNRIF